VNARGLVIAIDGPAASGKSTTARRVAERLGYLHIDTGAMYRAVTVKVLRNHLKPGDTEGIARLMASTHVVLRKSEDSTRVLLDGEDVTDAVRSIEVTNAVSAVSSLARVRAAMVLEQRSMGDGQGIVLEGRDIGTVVFPDADLKIFMTAGIEERALRRQRELSANGIVTDLEMLKKEIERRDRLDSTRQESPLMKAPDAIELDTSRLSIDEQVDFVVRRAEAILRQREG
jgi:CMP/dCMP kinase